MNNWTMYSSGDSVDCRFYHLGVAAADLDAGNTPDAMTHCTHAGVSGNKVCAASAASTAQVGFAVFSLIALTISKLL